MAVPAFGEIIENNDNIYRWLVGRAQNAGHPGEVLKHVVAAAAHASAFHTGRFADGAIENLAHRIGLDLDDTPKDGDDLNIAPARRKHRRVLHVTSHVVGIGGHTRMMTNWIRNDEGSQHSVVVTCQSDRAIPQWLRHDLERSGGRMVMLGPEMSLTAKALRLRNVCRRSADLVVLHHDGHDVVPTLALARGDTPPTIVLNHADHQFWLGSSVADLAVNLRSAAGEYSRTRRFIDRNTVLCVPLELKAGRSRSDARRALGIPDHQMMLLSIARPEKFRPSGAYNFLSTVGRILDRDQNARLFLVGETLAGITRELRSELHERIHFVGPLDDPQDYRAAADLYLETFPFGSQTALLEAALCGLPTVRAYAPLFPLLVANDDAINDLLPSPDSEEAYVERTATLMEKPDMRHALGAMLRSRVIASHTGAGWLAGLGRTYQATDCLVHAPRQIPITTPQMSAADASLSLWRVVADGRSSTAGALPSSRSAVMRHTAFAARLSGSYGLARHYSWQAIRCGPFDRSSWRLLLVSLLGSWAKGIRQALGQ